MVVRSETFIFNKHPILFCWLLNVNMTDNRLWKEETWNRKEEEEEKEEQTVKSSAVADWIQIL
jgi:hypothetical protein